MNFKIFQIPSVYTIWDRLSLKTISRYCPFNVDTLFPANNVKLSIRTGNEVLVRPQAK